MHSVFSDDSLGNSLALSHDANTPDEVMNKVGSISYNKGASVIRMMSHTLGNDRFIAALRNYLKTKWVSILFSFEIGRMFLRFVLKLVCY